MAEILGLTQEELAALEGCEAEPEAWDLVVEQILAARYGAYPPDWYEKVLASGIADRVTGGIKSHVFDNVSDALEYLRGEPEAPDA